MKTRIVLIIMVIILSSVDNGNMQTHASADPITYIISKTSDTNDGHCDKDCSLREAIIASNTYLGDSIIILPIGTYVLSIAGDIDITGNVTINGAGAFKTIIDENVQTRLHIYYSTVRLVNLTVRNGHQGGGVFNEGGNLYLTNSIIRDNEASGFGAGLVIVYGTTTINNSAIINNISKDDFGGGISNSVGSTLTITNSTISGNSAAMGGGAIWNFGTINLNNVTITANTSPDTNGGVLNNGSINIKNTIIAGNIAFSPGQIQPDCSGSLNSQGYNLIQNTSGCTIMGDITGNLIGIDPILGSLTDNGGATLTHALIIGSPAINAGNPNTPGGGGNSCVGIDQRYITRPQSSRCDIGAYEGQASGTPLYFIAGRIMDGKNNPISGVTLSDDKGHQTVSDSFGNFMLSGLSGGTYTISPSKSGYSFSPSSRSISLPSSRLGQDFVSITESLQTCTVPFFWQQDPKWDHPLRTNGSCLSSCSTIGACGCTLTSASMVFSFFGANINPNSLSDCMNTSACPFDWSISAGCSGGKASWVGRYYFSWNLLDKEINQNKRPVILGMHNKTDSKSRHWVVVTSGSGNNPDNYFINDPWFVGGQNMKLSSRTGDYNLVWISVYAGTPLCSPSQSILVNSVPQQTHSNDLDVIGDVLIYNISENNMTVQLIAQSNAGDTTEMQIWTDASPSASWQPFTTLVDLPKSDSVYVRFRDEYGNVSETFSDSIFPGASPIDQILSNFLPIIQR